MNMGIESVVPVALGIATLSLGLKGWSRDGLPVTSSRRLRGRAAVSIGSICILLGAHWIVCGLWFAIGAPLWWMDSCLYLCWRAVWQRTCGSSGA